MRHSTHRAAPAPPVGVQDKLSKVLPKPGSGPLKDFSYTVESSSKLNCKLQLAFGNQRPFPGTTALCTVANSTSGKKLRPLHLQGSISTYHSTTWFCTPTIDRSLYHILEICFQLPMVWECTSQFDERAVQLRVLKNLTCISYHSYWVCEWRVRRDVTCSADV